MSSATSGAVGSNYTLRVFDRVFFVDWRGLPTPEDLDALVARAEELHRRSGRRLLYLALIPDSADVPTGPSQEALRAFGVRATPHIEEGYLVVTGGGFRAAIHRSSITALYALKRGVSRIHVHKTLDAALAQIATVLRIGPDELARGLTLRDA
jgi:hypothetical protein